MPDRHVLVTPCDPGTCHIYFGVQIRALPTALSLARTTGRTLVLPPFEWYRNQAQLLANAFMGSADGRRPLFIPWSELFDIARLREGGVHVVDYHEAALEHLDKAILQTGHAGTITAGRVFKKAADVEAATASGSLDGVFADKGCRAGPGRDGLRGNLTLAGDAGAEGGVMRLYGRDLGFASLRDCRRAS